MVSEVKFNGTKTYSENAPHYELDGDDVFYALWDDYTHDDLREIGYPGTVYQGMVPILTVDKSGEVHEPKPSLGKMVVSTYGDDKKAIEEYLSDMILSKESRDDQ